jgi:hypothetical protein
MKDGRRMKKVACGSFVKRQTKESGHSHFEGTWEELEEMATYTLLYGQKASYWAAYPYKIHPGYRDGVVLAELDPSKFRSGIVDVKEDTKLKASYAPRRDGEAPFIRLSAKAEKQVAKYASVVLYRHDVLAENNERETDAEWEIVCIKARTSDEEEPMDPYTMARNFLHLKGGTKGDFSAEEFAKSIVYWNNHVMCSGNRSTLNKIRTFLKKVYC